MAVHGQVPKPHHAPRVLQRRAHDVLQRAQLLALQRQVPVLPRRGLQLRAELGLQRPQPVLPAVARRQDERVQPLRGRHRAHARKAHPGVHHHRAHAQHAKRVLHHRVLHLARHPGAHAHAALEAQALQHAHRVAVHLLVQLAQRELEVLVGRHQRVAGGDGGLADVAVVKGGHGARGGVHGCGEGGEGRGEAQRGKAAAGRAAGARRSNALGGRPCSQLEVQRAPTVPTARAAVAVRGLKRGSMGVRGGLQRFLFFSFIFWG